MASGSRSKSEASARLALAAACAAILAASLAVDLPRAAGGEFWGDGATYYAMTWSLARDGDLRYGAADLARIRAEYPGGPSGLFLKRAAGGLTIDAGGGLPWLRRVRPDEGRLYYAKAFAYPLLAAPLVAVLGTRGLLLANGLLLSLALVFAVATLRRRGLGSWPALAVAVSLLLLTVTPLYVVWTTPEILGLTLVAGGLWAWAADRPLLSAVLFGVAGYLKPPNLLMAAPLGLAPLLPAPGAPVASDLLRRVKEALRRGLVLGATALALYGVNAALTGEWNYQGGERKTFYGRYPFDAAGTTFDTPGAGFWMTTNQLGPLVAGRDDSLVSDRSGPARRRAELVQTLACNLGYFWLGRFGGAFAYFLPAFVALLLFLVLGPRDRAGWLALVAVVTSWFAYIWIIPDNWYGGGGTVGNRYFLNLLPAFLFLAPAARGRWRWLPLAGLAGVAVFLGPVFAHPIQHSLRPGAHATRAAFRALPAELTMLNDLSVFTETWRKKRPFGFVGNAERPADPDAFFLYFTDDGTYGKEEWAGRAGFWLRAGRPAEVIVRAFDLALVERVVVRLTGGPLGDTVDLRLGWHRQRVRLGPGERRDVELAAGRGIPYYDTYVHVLHLRSHRGGRMPDGRVMGAFVEPRLVMRPLLSGAR
jgi:hypothetical protein